MTGAFKLTLFFSALVLLISGCHSKKPAKKREVYTYRKISFGKHLSSAYKHGIRDGCETSRGIYTKSHRLFNNNIDYYNGWFSGRNRCRHLLKINENGDLIL
jgi:hypothetical protein